MSVETKSSGECLYHIDGPFCFIPLRVDAWNLKEGFLLEHQPRMASLLQEPGNLCGHHLIPSLGLDDISINNDCTNHMGDKK